MTTNQFIEKYYNRIVKHYKKQAKWLGYSKSQYNDYVGDVIGFTFIGTQEDIDKLYPNKNDYGIICKSKNIIAIENFIGIEHNSVSY